MPPTFNSLPSHSVLQLLRHYQHLNLGYVVSIHRSTSSRNAFVWASCSSASGRLVLRDDQLFQSAGLISLDSFTQPLSHLADKISNSGPTHIDDMNTMMAWALGTWTYRARHRHATMSACRDAGFSSLQPLLLRYRITTLLWARKSGRIRTSKWRRSNAAVSSVLRGNI